MSQRYDGVWYHEKHTQKLNRSHAIRVTDYASPQKVKWGALFGDVIH